MKDLSSKKFPYTVFQLVTIWRNPCKNHLSTIWQLQISLSVMWVVSFLVLCLSSGTNKYSDDNSSSVSDQMLLCIWSKTINSHYIPLHQPLSQRVINTSLQWWSKVVIAIIFAITLTHENNHFYLLALWQCAVKEFIIYLCLLLECRNNNFSLMPFQPLVAIYLSTPKYGNG